MLWLVGRGKGEAGTEKKGKVGERALQTGGLGTGGLCVLGVLTI